MTEARSFALTKIVELGCCFSSPPVHLAPIITLIPVVTLDVSPIRSEVTMSKRFERWTARAEAIVVGAALVLAAIAVISRLSG